MQTGGRLDLAPWGGEDTGDELMVYPAGGAGEAIDERSLKMVGRMRLYVAALAAVLLGMPLSEKALAGGEEVVWSSIDLIGAIIDAASNS
jgi:hypothetical protein